MKKRFLSVILALVLCLGLAVPGAASAPDRFDGSWRAQVSDNSWEAIRCTNVERAKEGLRPLSTFEGLHAAAQLRAVELKDKFSHTRPNGQPCMTALSDVGLDPYAFTRSGENIAAGYGSPAAVVTGWMNSTGHRKNILTGPFCHIGLGSDGVGWVQMFLGICEPQLTSVTVGKSSYPLGTALEDMEGVVALHCEHGDSYLPLSSEMCTGYDSTRAGSQSVTVRYMDQTASFTVTLKGSPRFTDVAPWCAEAVDWAVEQEVTNGRGNYKFAPNDECKQGEILTFLWRAAGRLDSDAEAPIPLTGDEWYAGALRWAAEKGMIGEGFELDAPCTRARAADFIWRAFNSPTGEGAPYGAFSDVAPTSGGSVGEFTAIHWAAGLGITNGYDNGDGTFSFRPNNVCSRGEIVTLLHRAYVPEARLK